MPGLWNRLFPRPTPAPIAVRCDADIVSIAYDNGELRQFRWEEVQRVQAWKLDCGIVDCICLDFELDSLVLTVHENVRGYDDLFAAMEAHLVGCRNDWWSVVAFPAFATNRTTVWSRDGSHVTPGS